MSDTNFPVEVKSPPAVRFAAVTVWDEARLVKVTSCDLCPFRRWHTGPYRGAFERCAWASAKGRRITDAIPVNGFPASCPLPAKAATFF